MKSIFLKNLIIAIFIFLTIAGFKAISDVIDKNKPEIIHLGMAAPDVVVFTVQSQWVKHTKQIPYEKKTGDEIEIQIMHRFIKRDGQLIGSLVGSEGKIMATPDKIMGDTLDTFSASRKESYSIVEKGGKAVAKIAAIYRKSKPVDCLRAPAREAFPMEHTFILKLEKPLVKGKTYTIRFKEGMLQTNEASFIFDPSQLRSEAVHVNQVGFRGDDPAKLGFLSFWMGNGGNLSYPSEVDYNLVNDKTGRIAFSGKTKLVKTAAEEGNKTKADIHELDFSAFSEPGVYKLSVEGVGCSFPFEINDLAWKNAFVKSMRGLYCQRSGIELGPPYTPFVRPRSFHPEDGVKVYISDPVRPGEDNSIRILTPDQIAKLETYKPSRNNFESLKKNLTNQTLPNAWGGYMDAGDWDRRPDHALLPLFLFDLAEMFPETYAKWNFNIPDSKDNLPDLINEALWEVDFLRRMQQPDGSVFGGIESGEHPRRGECSWQESLPVIAYARTKSTAYNYTSVGARAALWFQNNKMPEIAQGYKESVLKAFNWAEQQVSVANEWGGEGASCLAAAELYRLTGDEKYNKMFLASTRFANPAAPFYTSFIGANGDAQGEAGWTYLRTTHAGVNKEVWQNIYNSLVRDAEKDIKEVMETDFHWSGGNARQLWYGALSSPGSHVLCRAHFLTGKEDYLKAIVNSALTGAGANPVNMCYVTGVGSRWPQHPLHEDAYNTNQKVYEGITVGGPIDPTTSRHGNSVRILPKLYPAGKTWPATESYYDVFMYPPMNEYTVHQIMQSTSFVWGYLAGRK
jgi:endoglucanase